MAPRKVYEARRGTSRRDPVCCGEGGGETLTNQDGGGSAGARGGWEVTVVVEAAVDEKQRHSL